MKNVTSQVARKDDFFRRDKLIKKIYRHLDAGSNLFLAAPRRVGKTSIMRFLEDYPAENYCFIYVTVEAVYEIENFYYKLWTALAESNVQSFLEKAPQKIWMTLKASLDRIKGVGLPLIGGKIELNTSAKTTYQREFELLLKSLKTKDRHIIFMLDEFPQTIENIKNKHGKELAVQFLHLCRDQRQITDANIQFIYTGSIGLPSVVRSVASTSVINDLATIEVTPLKPKEAKKMAYAILKNYEVKYQAEAVDYLLKKLQWLIPFHIQLSLQEMIDIYETEEREVVKTDIDEVIKRLLNARNSQYFEQYHTRLKDAFPDEGVFEQIIILLNYVAENQTISKKKAYYLIGNHLANDDYERVIEALQFDGYLYFSDEQNLFSFASQLLRMWWKKFIVR